MTQEDKQLLIKDLCAKICYCVKGLHRGRVELLDCIDLFGEYQVCGYYFWFNLDTVPFKPYLRPMSSMTEEEWTEYEDMCDSFRGEGFYELIDWLNEKHFDYRGLIEKGLALEAPEGMYKID